VDADPLVIRIWGRTGDGFRPHGAERVARILAPHLVGLLPTLEADAWPDRAASSLSLMDSAAAASGDTRPGAGPIRATVRRVFSRT
ncbi:MAG: hypothetical protein H0U67_03585, partial [Gemmatimonadetes bacterium]|nr:hypothetical protein [Gemmatimonadota bacterium]